MGLERIDEGAGEPLSLRRRADPGRRGVARDQEPQWRPLTGRAGTGPRRLGQAGRNAPDPEALHEQHRGEGDGSVAVIQAQIPLRHRQMLECGRRGGKTIAADHPCPRTCAERG